MKMTENDAKEISSWKYDSEYAVYNMGNWKTICKENWAISNNDKREKQFRSVYKEEKLIGYFRFYKESDYYILGLGMNPQECGKGFGKNFMNFILNSKELKNKTIMLEVRTFNKRAIKCYLSVGFKIIDEIEKDTLSGKDKFIIMNMYN